MHLILTSNFPLPGNEAVAHYVKSTLDAPFIAWFAPHADMSRYEQTREQFSSYGFDHVRPLDRPPQSALLEDDAVIYLPGGNPMSFREAIEKEQSRGWLRQQVAQDRTLIAASGGAMLLTENISLFRLVDQPVSRVIEERAMFRGLGFLALEILPHFDQHSPMFLTKVQEYSLQVGNDIWCIPDGAAIVQFADKMVMPIGNVTILRNGAFVNPDI